MYKIIHTEIIVFLRETNISEYEYDAKSTIVLTNPMKTKLYYRTSTIHTINNIGCESIHFLSNIEIKFIILKPRELLVMIFERKGCVCVYYLKLLTIFLMSFTYV